MTSQISFPRTALAIPLRRSSRCKSPALRLSGWFCCVGICFLLLGLQRYHRGQWRRSPTVELADAPVRLRASSACCRGISFGESEAGAKIVEMTADIYTDTSAALNQAKELLWLDS